MKPVVHTYPRQRNTPNLTLIHPGNTMARPLRALGWLAVLLLPAAGCMSGRDAVTVQGCGATFPEPLYKRWFLEYYLKHPTVRTNYQGIGSGAGVRQLAEGLVDFGASDESLSEKKLAEVAADREKRTGRAAKVVQLPLTGGSVAICYTLPGNPTIKLGRKTYVSIFLGTITSWDDAAIAHDNPGVSLPHRRITVVRRAESSGTTFVFTNHLAAVDARWKNGP